MSTLHTTAANCRSSSPNECRFRFPLRYANPTRIASKNCRAAGAERSIQRSLRTHRWRSSCNATGEDACAIARQETLASRAPLRKNATPSCSKAHHSASGSHAAVRGDQPFGASIVHVDGGEKPEDGQEKRAGDDPVGGILLAVHICLQLQAWRAGVAWGQ